jgi:release factor glutamine methyltransferase
MSPDDTSTTLGHRDPVVIAFDGHRLRIDREPGVAAPNYYTDVVLGALARWPEAPRSVLDVGAGTGVLAIAAALRWPDAHVDGIDVDPAAVELAARNVEANDLAPARCRMLLSAAGEYAPDRSYDLIVANPPQIPVPDGDDSLSGAGPDGTAAALETIALTGRALAPDGRLLLALADFVPGEPIREAAASAGLALAVQEQVVCRAGPFTTAHRAWIERSGYRFTEGASGPEFRLQLLVARRA